MSGSPVLPRQPGACGVWCDFEVLALTAMGCQRKTGWKGGRGGPDYVEERWGIQIRGNNLSKTQAATSLEMGTWKLLSEPGWGCAQSDPKWGCSHIAFHHLPFSHGQQRVIKITWANVIAQQKTTCLTHRRVLIQSLEPPVLR